MKLHAPDSGLMSTIPRLFDVSTTPGTCTLIRFTPCGAACSVASQIDCSPTASRRSMEQSQRDLMFNPPGLGRGIKFEFMLQVLQYTQIVQGVNFACNTLGKFAHPGSTNGIRWQQGRS